MSILTVTIFDPLGVSVLARLPQAYAKTFQDDLTDVGSFSFSVRSDDPALTPTALSVGNVVKFAYGERSDDYRFAGIIEQNTAQVSGADAEASRSFDVSGRGVRARLEDAVVYPPSGKSKATSRSFNAKPGNIFRILFLEAQARGALTGMSVGFTDTTDTNGVSFPSNFDIDEDVGATLADVAMRHQDLAVDVWVSPSQVINYYLNKGTDRTTGANPLTLRPARDIGDLTGETAGPIKNTLLITGSTGAWTTKQNASSVSTYGRRETSVSSGAATSSNQVTKTAQEIMARSATPSDAVTLQLLPTTGVEPYIDFDLGDWVYAPNAQGVRTRYRVRSITITEDETGTVICVPELGTSRDTLVQKLQRTLNRLALKAAGGSEGSLVGAVPEAKDPATTVSAALYPIVAQHSYNSSGSRAVSPRPMGRFVRDVDNVAGFGANAIIGPRTTLTTAQASLAGTSAAALTEDGESFHLGPFPGTSYGQTTGGTTFANSGGGDEYIIFDGNLWTTGLSRWVPSSSAWTNRATPVAATNPPRMVVANGRLWSSGERQDGSGTSPTLYYVAAGSTTPVAAISVGTGVAANGSNTRFAGSDGALWLYAATVSTSFFRWMTKPADTTTAWSVTSDADAGVSALPGVDSSGNLWRVISVASTGTIRKLTTGGAATNYTGVWTSADTAPVFVTQIEPTSSAGTSFYILGAMNGAYAKTGGAAATNAVTIPAIWLWIPGQAATVVWAGTRHAWWSSSAGNLCRSPLGSDTWQWTVGMASAATITSPGGYIGTFLYEDSL